MAVCLLPLIDLSTPSVLLLPAILNRLSLIYDLV